MKKDFENAKNPRWQVPVDLPSVKPEDYDVSIDSAGGSANAKTQMITPSKKSNADLPKEEQKKLGKYPLHDEEIGGA